MVIFRSTKKWNYEPTAISGTR